MTVPQREDPLIFEFYDKYPMAESMTNNGHSVTVTLQAFREIIFPKGKF